MGPILVDISVKVATLVLWTVTFSQTFLADLLSVKKNVYVIGHSPLGLFRTNVNKQWQINIQICITCRLRIPAGGRQTSWLFTGVAEKLTSGLPWTTSAISYGQNGIWIRDLRISNPSLWPLGHAPSLSMTICDLSVANRRNYTEVNHTEMNWSLRVGY